MQAILDSMTKKEREFPQLINGQRKKRIAKGSGTSVQEINRLLKQYLQMKKMMKTLLQGLRGAEVREDDEGAAAGVPPVNSQEEVAMVSLLDLWLPILVSAVVIQIVSSIMYMALPFWHTADYGKPDDDRPFLERRAPAAVGHVHVPEDGLEEDDRRSRRRSGQTGRAELMYMRNPATFSFPKTLRLYFLYCLVERRVCAAYIAGQTLAHGTPYMRVFQIAGATGMIFWSFGNEHLATRSGTASRGRWRIKHVIDGLILRAADGRRLRVAVAGLNGIRHHGGCCSADARVRFRALYFKELLNTC